MLRCFTQQVVHITTLQSEYSCENARDQGARTTAGIDEPCYHLVECLDNSFIGHDLAATLVQILDVLESTSS
jgi:hypothetical protein